MSVFSGETNLMRKVCQMSSIPERSEQWLYLIYQRKHVKDKLYKTGCFFILTAPVQMHVVIFMLLSALVV